MPVPIMHFRILYTLLHMLLLSLISHFIRRNFCTFAFSQLYLPDIWQVYTLKARAMVSGNVRWLKVSVVKCSLPNKLEVSQ